MRLNDPVPLLMLIAPSLNRVYAGEAPRLAAAELAVTAGVEVEPVVIAGVDYLRIDAEDSEELRGVVARLSARLGLYEDVSGLLRPLDLPTVDLLDEDLVTIPKYPGKTNEQLTRLLLNVTLSQVSGPGMRSVLDPLCGRGTTLLQAWRLGHDAAGIESDQKAVEAFAAYLKTYLRRKRLKHSAEMTPVRREGKSLCKRFDADVTFDGRRLTLGVFTGDTRQSAYLWGKRRFDAIVTDAPYGVVHGSVSDVRGGTRRDRSASGLLADAIPVWVSQLRIGGALGMSWNTLGTPRERVAELLTSAGLVVRDEGPWRRFAHRVDSSVHRDVIVAVRES